MLDGFAGILPSNQAVLIYDHALAVEAMSEEDTASGAAYGANVLGRTLGMARFVENQNPIPRQGLVALLDIFHGHVNGSRYPRCSIRHRLPHVHKESFLALA